MRHEKYGTRDLTYSGWHRTLPLRASYIDIDGVEYCGRCRQPLLLVETAQDVGQTYKSAKVTAALGEMANVPVVCVLYTIAGPGLIGPTVRVREVAPYAGEFQTITREAWAAELVAVHDRHEQKCRLRRSA